MVQKTARTQPMRKTTVRARERPGPIGIGGGCSARWRRRARSSSRSHDANSPGPEPTTAAGPVGAALRGGTAGGGLPPGEAAAGGSSLERRESAGSAREGALSGGIIGRPEGLHELFRHGDGLAVRPEEDTDDLRVDRLPVRRAVVDHL